MFNKWFIKVPVIGFFMGIADAIPGVSGGTVAYITGIYKRWVSAFSNLDFPTFKLLFSFKIKEAVKRADLYFLLILYIGVGGGFLLSGKVIHSLLKSNPLQILSFFLGVVLSSGIDLLVKSYKESIKISRVNKIIVALMGVGIGYLIVSIKSVNLPDGLFYTFLSGILAICAMVLPGISGSYTLVILGKYQFMLSALYSLEVPHIIAFMIGCFLGVVFFSKLIKFIYKRWEEVFLIFFSAFIIGTVAKIYPWKFDPYNFEFSYNEFPWNVPYDPHYLSVIGFFTAGVLFYLALLQRFKI